MFERLQKPFLTVETGEAYQPIRLTYQLSQRNDLIDALNQLKCCEKSQNGQTWNWFWRDECSDLHFESIDSFKKTQDLSLRLGTFTLRNGALFLNLPSFKRACLAVPFFHKLFDTKKIQVVKADFLNKVFGTDEHLPHRFAELFKEDELEDIIKQRIYDYEMVQGQVEQAKSPEEAFSILAAYTHTEAKKRLPYAERYRFETNAATEAEVVFLGFYIFLRGRELVAIRRWFGEAGYSLANVLDDAVEDVFGNMDIDLID